MKTLVGLTVLFISPARKTVPLAATVASVNENGSLNLNVIGGNGQAFVRNNVLLWNDPNGHEAPAGYAVLREDMTREEVIETVGGGAYYVEDDEAVDTGAEETTDAAESAEGANVVESTEASESNAAEGLGKLGSPMHASPADAVKAAE